MTVWHGWSQNDLVDMQRDLRRVLVRASGEPTSSWDAVPDPEIREPGRDLDRAISNRLRDAKP